MMINITNRLRKLNLELPNAPEPVGNYQATLLSGSLLYISGQLPIIDGKVIYKGQLGKTLTVEEGIKAAELCALNILSQIQQSTINQPLKQVVKVEGYINASESFEQHAQVLNGASDLFAKVLGESAGHIRTVVGCTSLPLGVPVEISIIAELES
jgi:enamine deaminase RidA (YjgF/YER057c/UK114 family)